MQDVADNLVSWLLERVGVPAQPPIDLGRLASKMAIDEIIDVPMMEDGRLEVRRDHAVIYLRDDLSAGRRQFTIAHELGHRLLLHPRVGTIAYRRRLTGDTLERLCDDIAAALLLPRGWVESEFSGTPPNLATLRRMGQLSSTSLSASLVRLREVQHWQHSLLRFSYASGKWRLLAPAGVPGELHGKLRTTTSTHETLAAVGSRTRDDFLTMLPIRIAGTAWLFPAELSVHTSAAIALVDLTRPKAASCG